MIDVPFSMRGRMKPEEEGQQQGADMAAVHIGIGHDDDLAVPQLLNIELLADAAAQSRDHRHQLVVAVDLVQPGLLHVEHLAPQGKDGLEPAVPSHLGASRRPESPSTM